MRKFVQQMTVVLILAFALGAIVGISSPTEVLAEDDLCIGLMACYSTGAPGTGGCAWNEVPWAWHTMTRFSGKCCGDVTSSGCLGV